MTKVFRAILFFGLISIGIDLIRKLIFTEFEMTRIFNIYFFIYEMVLEFLFLIITAFVTHLLVRNISKDNLGISLSKALIFGSIYGIVCLISSIIISLIIGAGLGFQFDIYDSFVKFIPNGFTKGVLFLLVMHQLIPKNRILTDNTHNPLGGSRHE
ncbi:MAG: hypothetical protein H6607_03015 [Flavobacteriales bacterium]|nr:hypothetical protein [Flavobacteriales bacterium]